MAPRIQTIGLDIGKEVFQAHGIDRNEMVVLRRKLRRAEVTAFFAGLRPCLVGMEATAGSHHWARTLAAMGHKVRVIPAAYVKAYVKTNKSDAKDAEAICEAVRRPGMRFAAVKTKEQQATLIVHRTRELLVRQRIVLTNALRGFLAEFGIVAPRGYSGTNKSLEAVRGAEIPSSARPALQLLKQAVELLRKQSEACEDQIGRHHTDDADSVRLATIPHVGPITASAVIATIGNAGQFCSARQFAAWLGLVPREFSTGGKQKLGHISKRGNPYLRRLLFLAASSALRDPKFAKTSAGAWALSLRARKPYRLTVIALAARLARTMWAMLMRRRNFEPYPERLAHTGG